MTGAVEETPRILLRHHLKKLKLPTVLREHEKLARQCATEGVDHVRYLARLIELELLDREARMIERRIKAAKFPAVKSLESFDFDALPALNKKLVLDLARGEFVDDRENVIALGPSGTGKTQVSIATPGSMPRGSRSSIRLRRSDRGSDPVPGMTGTGS
jgi:DNA replication protein DnaC